MPLAWTEAFEVLQEYKRLGLFVAFVPHIPEALAFDESTALTIRFISAEDSDGKWVHYMISI